MLRIDTGFKEGLPWLAGLESGFWDIRMVFVSETVPILSFGGMYLALGDDPICLWKFLDIPVTPWQ